MVTIDYVAYHRETGRIVQSGTCLADDLGIQCTDRPGVEITPGDGKPDTHYVSSSGEILERESLQYTTETSGLTFILTGLPEGTEVKVGDASVIADSAPTELEFDVPGTYTVELKGMAWHLDEELEVAIG